MQRAGTKETPGYLFLFLVSTFCVCSSIISSNIQCYFASFLSILDYHPKYLTIIISQKCSRTSSSRYRLILYRSPFGSCILKSREDQSVYG